MQEFKSIYEFVSFYIPFYILNRNEFMLLGKGAKKKISCDDTSTTLSKRYLCSGYCILYLLIHTKLHKKLTASHFYLIPVQATAMPLKVDSRIFFSISARLIKTPSRISTNSTNLDHANILPLNESIIQHFTARL